jgi:hypothetical protein
MEINKRASSRLFLSISEGGETRRLQHTHKRGDKVSKVKMREALHQVFRQDVISGLWKFQCDQIQHLLEGISAVSDAKVCPA